MNVSTLMRSLERTQPNAGRHPLRAVCSSAGSTSLSLSRFVIFVTAVSTFGMLACGAARSAELYLEPTTGERARIRIFGDGVVQVARKDCARSEATPWGVALSANPLDFFSPKGNNNKSLGIPSLGAQPPKTRGTELYVQTGQPILFYHYMSVNVTGGTKTCKTMFAFVPETGKDYEAAFLISADLKSCIRNVVELASPSVRIRDIYPEISESKDCSRRKSPTAAPTAPSS